MNDCVGHRNCGVVGEPDVQLTESLVPISFFNRWIPFPDATLSPEEGTRLISRQTVEVDSGSHIGPKTTLPLMML